MSAISILTILLTVVSTLFIAAAVLAVGVLLKPKPAPPPLVQSFLAPVLAADALDSDLRVLYAESMVLDAIWEEEHSPEDPQRLGAELRRLILEIQAERVRSGSTKTEVLPSIAKWMAEAKQGGLQGWQAQVREVRELRKQISRTGTLEDRSFQQ